MQNNFTVSQSLTPYSKLTVVSEYLVLDHSRHDRLHLDLICPGSLCL